MKKIIFLISIIPLITFGAWYNPFDWFDNSIKLGAPTNTYMSNLPANSLISTSPLKALTSTSSPTVGYITATSTTATSTFAGGLQAGGSTGLYVLQNGNVGVGTSSPSSMLDVYGVITAGVPTATTPQFIIKGGSSGTDLVQLQRTSGATITYGWSLSGGRMSFKDVTNNLVTLSIGLNGLGGGDILGGQDQPSGYSTVGVPSTFRAGNAGTGGTDISGGSLYLATGKGEGAGTSPDIYFQTADPTTSGSTQQSLSTKLTIKGAGNVGIGTTSPTNKLGVSGGFIDVDGTTGGYKIDNRLILQASSTNQSTLVGDGAGVALLSDGIQNTAFGYNALSVATSSDYNTAFGYYALRANTTGNLNNAQGWSALSSNTTGSYNTAQGHNALLSNTTSDYNTAVGASALRKITTNGSNTAVGFGAAENTTGSSNTALGMYALQANTSGASNIAVGYYSLTGNLTGNYNSILGSGGGRYNLSATNTTAVGYAAARGTANYSNQGGVYLGYQAGYSASTGSDYNTLLGYQAGYGITTGAYNIALGQNVDVPSVTGNQQLNIGNVLFGTGMYNGSSVSGLAVEGGKIGISTTTPWAKLSIAAMSTNTSPLFAVSTSTASATTTAFIIDSNGFTHATVNTMQLSSLEDQTATVANTAYPVTFNNNDMIDSGFTHSTVTNNATTTVNNSGVYEIVISAVVTPDTVNKHATVWLNVDNQDIANSATLLEPPSGASGLLAVSLFHRFTAGQNFQLRWASDDAGTLLDYNAAGSVVTPSPASPSVIMTVKKISN